MAQFEAQTGVGANTAWPAAFTASTATTGASPEGVRDFLDGRHGRHFADDVVGMLLAAKPVDTAIAATITRWQGWLIARRINRETCIPAGLPYLTGFATHFDILVEDPVDA